jgi:hypothetical protein
VRPVCSDIARRTSDRVEASRTCFWMFRIEGLGEKNSHLARRSLCDGSGAEGWNKRALGRVVFGVQGKEGGWL